MADKGYDADAIRADLAERGIEAVIPARSNRRVKIEHDRELYKQRNQIERFFGRLKINRAIATRYDQLAERLPIHGPHRNGTILAQICPRRLGPVDAVGAIDGAIERRIDNFAEALRHKPGKFGAPPPAE